MASFKLSIVLVAALVALVQSAPAAEPEATTTPVATTTVPTSTTSASTSPASPESVSDGSPATTTTSSMAVGSASEHATKINATTFTCYGRDVGYYADVDLECRVYHFCLPGDFNGEPVFQRISYLCLNETLFDQQALDCVTNEKITAPCRESVSHYEASNKVLRQAILKQGDKNSSVTSASTTPTTAN